MPEGGVRNTAVMLSDGDIVTEQISDDVGIRSALRTCITTTVNIRSKATKVAENLKQSMDMYYDYRESLKTVPGHRLLAIRHGSKEQVLSWKNNCRR